MHVKLDTGMGRWGSAELAVAGARGRRADDAPRDGRLRRSSSRARRSSASATATEPYPHLPRHVANSAAALRIPESRFDAARCGIALYGISPVRHRPGGGRPRAGALVDERARAHEAAPRRRVDRLRPPLRRRAQDTWIGIVPVGYADGFRRDLTGTEVLVDGERRRVIGAVSMDAIGGRARSRAARRGRR